MWENDELLRKTSEYLKQLVANESGISVHKINVDQLLENYGLESVMILNLTEEIGKHFSKLSQTLFFEYKTIRELADYFVNQHTEELERMIGFQVEERSKFVENDHSLPISMDNDMESQESLPSSKSRRLRSKRQIHEPKSEDMVKEKTEDMSIEADSTQERNEGFAIIGLAGRYPGADNLEEFWECLSQGRDSITEIPKERWDYGSYYHPNKEMRGKSYSKWGGFIKDGDCFDALFFNISPKEADLLDPQERVFLETVWHAVEDAGYTRMMLSEKTVGVYVGVMYGHYQLYGLEETLKGNPVATGSAYASMANRVSYVFDFKGPSMAVDTMCSSSLATIHLACESLARGEIDVAVAGGVNLTIHPQKYLQLSQGRFASSDGKCRAFGEGGDGYVPGEGVGAVIIKPLKQAIADRDHIYAVIKGTALNHGGRTNGYTVPNPVAQQKVIQRTMESAGIDARTIGYIEAHGTGTSLGDPIEISGLTNAFRSHTEDLQYCSIGSVKSNIGHLESAAGIAGITKILLQMKHKKLVPSLHSLTTNSRIPFEETPFYVQHKLEDWVSITQNHNGKEISIPRRAGVSSFGAGGTNAHILLEEYEDLEAVKELESSHLIVLSAFNEDRLLHLSNQLSQFIEIELSNPESNLTLARLAYTLQTGREALEERLAFVATSLSEVAVRLHEFTKNNSLVSSMFRNNTYETKEHAYFMHEVLSDQAHTQLIFDNLTKNKDYENIAKLWVSGVEFDWCKWYMDAKPVKISLPVYPFAREKHWVSSAPEDALALEASNSYVPHPLLDRNVSTLHMQGFEKRFTVQDTEVCDHLVSGKKVLPGAIMIEMAFAAGSLSNEFTQIDKLLNVSFLRPVVVEDSVDMRVVLSPDEDSCKFSIYSIQNSATSEMLHCEGIISYEESEEGEAGPKHIDLLSLDLEFDRSLSGDEFYEQLKVEGLDYGSMYRTIKEIYYNAEEAQALLQIPTEMKRKFEGYNLHYSILDGALQVVSVLSNYHAEAPFLPFAVGELQIFNKLSERVYVHAFRKEEPSSDSMQMVFDLYITDEDGCVLAMIEGVVYRRSKVGLLPHAELCGLYPKWELTEQVQSDDSPMRQENQSPIVLLSKDPSLKTELSDKWESSIIHVNLGMKFEKKEQTEYEIDRDNPQHIELLLSEWKSQGRLPRIWIMVASEGEKVCSEEETGVFFWINVIHTLRSLHVEEDMSFLFIHHGEEPAHTAYSGFFKSMHLEHPRYRGRVIEVHPSCELDLVDICEEELRHGFLTKNEVRYSAQGRLEKVYEERTVLNQEETLERLDYQGVYLVTGGAGGLGLLFGEYLLRRGAGKVVLLGRSELSNERQSKVEEIARYGNGHSLQYIQTDITNRQQVEESLKQIRSSGQVIRGLIHAAGVLRDGFLLNKTRQEIDEVLAPKLDGTRILDEALMEDKLDFFVMFSSISAAFGSLGQSDYAYANRYMDHFAEIREELRRKGQRYGVTVSIGWPLWAEGGMRTNQRTTKAMQEKHGFIPMSASQGFRAFEIALVSEEPHVIFVERTKNNSEKTEEETTTKIIKSDKRVSTTVMNSKTAVSDKEDWKIETEQFLRELLSKETGIPENKIRTDEGLEHYGLDSVMIMNIMAAIEPDFPDVSKTIFFEYQTLKALTQYFIDHQKNSLEQKFGYEIKARKLNHREEIEENRVSQQVLKQKRTTGVKSSAQRFFGQSQSNVNFSSGEEDIAIVGISGKFPQADNLEQFWENLLEGKDSITEVPESRWNHAKYYRSDKETSQPCYTKWGGFLDNVERFDPLFFNISPREAELLDPQERIFLETAWHTVENAGYTRATLSGRKVGVYVGVMYGHYQLYGAEELQKNNILTPGSSFASIANRVSYYFNLNGPSISLDTMCSSSLTAIHLACESLKRGETEMAIAGGVNLSLHPLKYIQLSQGKFASSDGKCRSFGDGGDGYVPGEGVGALLLKPLSRAVEDGDPIHAVIKASVVNHGGKTNGYTVPNPNAQRDLLVEAMSKAKVDARSISYIEAHGTGTALGDPIEITGLAQAFAKDTSDTGFCSIGSVKSNIGHLESAAGIAGIVKVLLQMKNKKLVPSLHAETPNPNIEFGKTPFNIQKKVEEWKQPIVNKKHHIVTYPRRAGVSSFGAGGANAHIILEEFEQPNMEYSNEEPFLIILSAQNDERLKVYAAHLLRWSETIEESLLRNTAYTLQTGRQEMEYRLAFIARSKREMKERLTSFVNGKAESFIYVGDAGSNNLYSQELLNGREGEEYVNIICQDKKYDKLAQLWVKGVQIPWNLLYESIPNRISLPGYPFGGKTYWYSAGRTDVSDWIAADSTLNIAIEKSLLGPINSLESLKQQGLVYSRRWNASERLLADHLIDGKAVLPGAVYMDLAWNAMEQLHLKEEYDLKQLTWHRPLIVSDELDVQFRVKKEQESFIFEVYSQDNEITHLHCSGSFAPTDRELLTVKEEYLDLERLRLHCVKQINREELYDAFKETGIEYKQTYKTVQEIVFKPSEALGMLQLSNQADEQFQNSILIDGALQVIAALNVVNKQQKLPYTIGAIESYCSSGSQMFAYVKETRSQTYEICLVEPTGRICVKLRDVILRSGKKRDHGLYYIPQWTEFQNAPKDTEPYEGAVIIVHNHGSKSFAAEIAKCHSDQQVFQICLSDRNAQQSPLEYTIKTDDSSAMEKHFKECLRLAGSVGQIYYLGGFFFENLVQTTEDLKRTQEEGVLNLFRLLKAVGKLNNQTSGICLKVLTNRTFSIDGVVEPIPFGASMYGLVKSAEKEYANLDVHCIDLDMSLVDSNGTLRSITKKVTTGQWPGQGVETLLRYGKKYVRSFVPIEFSEPQSSLPIRNQGVYVILGGAGGIGLELSRHLTKHYRAHVFLIGRSQLSEANRKMMQDLTQWGGTIEYIQGDANDEVSIKAAVLKVKERHSDIHGVIHSAIVLHDQSLNYMEEETFCKVIEPKVQGSFNLYQAVKNEPLDFMLFLSSAQSFSGSAGQSNYAAGCTFKDAFAHHINRKHSFEVKIANWGYWGSVGVVASEKYNKLLESQGVYSILPEEGIKAIECLLGGSPEQMLVIKSDKKVLETLNVDFQSSSISYPIEKINMDNVVKVESSDAISEEEVQKIDLRYREIENYSIHSVIQFFRQEGIFINESEKWLRDDLTEAIGLLPKYERLFDSILDLLTRNGFLEMSGDRVLTTEKLTLYRQKEMDSYHDKAKRKIISDYPELTPHYELLDHCIKAYPKVLRGEKNEMEVLFPDNSVSLVENIYKGNKVSDWYNEMLAKAVQLYVKELTTKYPERKVRILEAGAGTGGSSVFVFKALQHFGEHIEYLYTDISHRFTEHGRKNFGTAYRFAQFKTLNLEQDLVVQGYEPHSIDIVFATNVIHATKNINQTLKQLKSLLRPNGTLFLNEATMLQAFTTLTFGLTEGWWMYDDEEVRISGSPLLSPGTWESILRFEGYQNVQVVQYKPVQNDQCIQSLITCQTNGILIKQSGVKRIQSNSVSEQPVEAKLKTIASGGESLVLKEQIMEDVKNEFAMLLKMDPKELNEDMTYEHYGVDSLVVMELTKRFEQKYGKLSGSLLFEYITIRQLVEYFYELQKNNQIEEIPPTEIESTRESDSKPANTNQWVEELTEDEINRLLLQLTSE